LKRQTMPSSVAWPTISLSCDSLSRRRDVLVRAVSRHEAVTEDELAAEGRDDASL